MRTSRWWTRARDALVGALAGYLVGVVIAVPIAALVFGEATTTTQHRADLWAFGFWGGVLGGLAGAVLGYLRAGRSDPVDAAPPAADPPGRDG